MLVYYDSKNTSTPRLIGQDLSQMLDTLYDPSRPLILLCIGSDSSTGDSLGPLIGYKLEKQTSKGLIVYGTLNNPVHAMNLEQTLFNISTSYENPFIIAIDASLGKEKHIGYVTLGTGSLKPGIGVKKQLPEVGDLHMTGIVNAVTKKSSLQATRLSVTMALADAIADGVFFALNKT